MFDVPIMTVRIRIVLVFLTLVDHLLVNHFLLNCASDRWQGYMLTCVSYPKSDLHFTVIEEDDLP